MRCSSLLNTDTDREGLGLGLGLVLGLVLVLVLGEWWVVESGGINKKGEGTLKVRTVN